MLMLSLFNRNFHPQILLFTKQSTKIQTRCWICIEWMEAMLLEKIFFVSIFFVLWLSKYVGMYVYSWLLFFIVYFLNRYFLLSTQKVNNLCLISFSKYSTNLQKENKQTKQKWTIRRSSNKKYSPSCCKSLSI